MAGFELRRLVARLRGTEDLRGLEANTSGNLYVITADTTVVAREFAANQTNLPLVAAPGAGYRLVLYDIAISTAEAVTVLLQENAIVRRFGRLTIAANGSFIFNSSTGVRLAPNASLTLTTTGVAAGPFAITVNYAVEAV